MKPTSVSALSRCAPALALAMQFLLVGSAHAQTAAAAITPLAALPADDATWLRAHGTLIFHDAFEREETGHDAKAIGNGWNSATADRVPQIKMADLDDGILKISSATKEADTDWHELVLVTEGDEMRLSLDGKLVARHRSAGFAHPMKRWFSFLVPSTVWIDEVKIWKVR